MLPVITQNLRYTHLNLLHDKYSLLLSSLQKLPSLDEVEFVKKFQQSRKQNCRVKCSLEAKRDACMAAISDFKGTIIPS